MRAQQQCHRLVNSIAAFGAGALLSGPLWRPELARSAERWFNGHGVLFPWQRSCPVPSADSRS